MSPDERLRNFEGGINTLVEAANKLAHAGVALTDRTEVESLSLSELESAMLDCKNRFDDYRDSPT